VDLNQQEVLKKHQKDRLKQEDALFANLQDEHSRTTEEKRREYFDRLKHFQDLNDRKLAKVSSMLVQD